jgi:DNA-binding LytR/AlgR family response regulator
MAAEEPAEPATNSYGLPERTGFRALLPFHLGSEVVSLQAEDHYVRVVTDKGNALVRYRFADALAEVRGLPGIQVHRSHWVAVRAVERVRTDAKGHRLVLNDGSEVPVSRSNVGVLKAAGLC